MAIAVHIAGLLAWAVSVVPANAGVSCDDKHPLDNHPVVGADGATNSTNAGVDGVRGTLLVPSWTSANLRGQSDTAADVILNVEDSAGHFFQLGWYISEGGTGALEATSTPKPFFAEGIAGMYGLEETLTTLQVPLAPGAHTFEIVQMRSSDPYWNLKYAASIDNSQVWNSSMISTMEATPSVVGETNWDCADMYESAASPSGGPGLYGHHRTRGWSLWQQHIDRRYNSAFTNPGCWAVGRYQNQTATSFAWDVC
jgi:hypothetical protein